jgi:hypothetical protein
VVNVVKGKRSAAFTFCVRPLARTEILLSVSYRFRLVSISCDPNFTFSIDDHMMTVIEVDGTNVKPLRVDSIQIFAGESLCGHTLLALTVEKGQRYSFVVS